MQQIFTGPELVGLRVRLRGLLQKHLQLDIATTEFGNSILKSVELEWRKCSYEPIAAAKKFKSVRIVLFLIAQSHDARLTHLTAADSCVSKEIGNIIYFSTSNQKCSQCVNKPKIFNCQLNLLESMVS